MHFTSLNFLIAGAAALNNGVGKLPKMGYNSKPQDPYFGRAH